MHIFLSVPIVPPEDMPQGDWEAVEQGDYDLDRPDRYERLTLGEDEYVFRDDQQQFCYVLSAPCESMDEAKRWRQTRRPRYMVNERLPLLERMEALRFQPRIEGYDKALAHLTVYIDRLTGHEGSSVRLSRWANLDGYDDPLVVMANHYLTNRYGVNLSYHLAGFGTHSFATVTDNQFYWQQLLKPRLGILYLLYYTYWVTHRTVPSRQMMPMLLENLWRSTTIRDVYNPALLTISPIV